MKKHKNKLHGLCVAPDQPKHIQPWPKYLVSNTTPVAARSHLRHRLRKQYQPLIGIPLL